MSASLRNSFLLCLLGCFAPNLGCQTQSNSAAPAEESLTEVSVDGRVLEISSEKRKVLEIETTPLKKSHWIDYRSIPAKLELDPDRHFAITAPVDVIIEEMLAELGNPVEAGSPLLRLSSPEITKIRGIREAGKTRLQQAEEALQWHRDISTNLSSLKELISQEKDPAELARWAKSQTIGKNGGLILDAYTQWHAAQRIHRTTGAASTSGAISTRTAIERESEVSATRGALESIIQQGEFEAKQNILKALGDASEARSLLASSESELEHLQGWLNGKEEEATTTSDPRQDSYVYRSPRAGIVLERYFARGERAALGETLVLVADLSRLWGVGELRTQDWDLLDLEPGTKLKVEIVGMERLGPLEAELTHLGGMVGSTSGSIRIATSIANEGNFLRPGMFGRILVERVSKDETRILPLPSIFSHDGEDFVLEKKADDQFVMRRVRLGRKNPHTVEVLSELSGDAQYVSRGTFAIASEALLESEE